MEQLTQLSDWLCVQPQHSIAVHQDRTVSSVELVQKIDGWMTALSPYSGIRWAVYHTDTCEFLAILLALWQLQRTACVPGDNCQGTVQRLNNHVDGFVGEFPGSGVSCVTEPVIRDINHEWLVLAPDFAALEIYTSGSTGEPKPITKTIAQLDKEVQVLESLWPSYPGSVVLATVSHQHIYGMMFRLFWPFCTQRAFEQRLCEYTEDVLQLGHLYPRFSLVSSPSHLSRMNTSLQWHEMHGRCLSVTSSAAPLNADDSLQVAGLLQTDVREIYGSSETGAIAWRRQSGGKDGLWRALPGLKLKPSAAQTLLVSSPYLEDDEPLELPDQVEFDNGGAFRLLGRIDRIVKVEGKRVSLSAIEQALIQSELIKNCKVLTIERKRVETAVVAELSENGVNELQSQGRRIVIGRLRSLLKQSFEAVILPRRWRFVENLPYNSQGKLTLNALQAMFEKEPVKWPDIKSQQEQDGQLSMHCFIPEELVYFDGHFEGNPILPGVVQVHWAEAFGRKLLGVRGRFVRLEVVKFQQVIFPQSTVDLVMSYTAEKGKLNFRYESDKGVHSSGRICFE